MARCNAGSRAAVLAALAMMLGCAPVARAITSDTLRLAPQKTAAETQATQLQASLIWKEVSPSNRDVYMAISADLGYGLPAKNGARDRCNSGYLGAQFRADGHHTLLWSMSGRDEGQIVPVGKYCHYDCFDCAPPNKRDFQCKRDDYKLSLDVNYTFTMQMETQNASGAMWSVTMLDPTAADAGLPIEVGRVFFKDREFGLPEENCRVLGVDSYIFQEYWNPNQQEFTTRASWSAISFSGSMRPHDTNGYCQSGASGSLANLEGLTRAECKSTCMAEERCHFASYSDKDFAYAKQDGSHCMLFDRCDVKDAFLADIWWTYEKVHVPALAAVALTEQCQSFRDQNGDERTAVAAVHRLPGGPVELEFDVGQDVQCVTDAGHRLLSSAAARGTSHLVGPVALESAAPSLRGSALAAFAPVATPKLAAAEDEVLMFP